MTLKMTVAFFFLLCSSVAATIYPSFKPTVQPTLSPTLIPTRFPTRVHFSPTVAPTITTFPIVQFNTSFQVSNVQAQYISQDGIAAFCKTIASISNSSTDNHNIIFLDYKILKINGAINITMQIDSSLSLSVGNYPTCANNATLLYSIISQALTQSIMSQSFTTILQQQAQYFAAYEFLTTQGIMVTNTVATIITPVPFTTSSDDSTLTQGEIAGTVLGIIFGLLFIVLLCIGLNQYFLQLHNNKQQPHEVQEEVVVETSKPVVIYEEHALKDPTIRGQALVIGRGPVELNLA